MREGEKAVDGLELERAERERELELEKADEEDLEEADAEPLRDVELEHRDVVLAAMIAILENRQLVIANLHLPQRELRALDALKSAVSGRDQELNQFVYASDRSELLEQALAVLQPTVAELPRKFPELVHRVGVLRTDLHSLVDAQDELLDGHRHVSHVKSDSDTADKPEPDAEDASPASTLAGPERELELKPSSSLEGPEPAREATPPSSLGGPEPDPEPEPVSALGDAAEIEADQEAPKKKPWWRRPFGG